MYVVFIHGPAAAGKYTIGTELSKLLGIPLFHNHLAVDVAKTLFEFGTAPFSLLRATIWLESFRQATSANVSFIFTFHPEATVSPDLIHELTGIIASAGSQVHFVELRCSESAVLERIGNPGRAKFGKLLDGDLYMEISAAGGFDFPDLPAPLVMIDTEAMDPVSAAKKIQAALDHAT